MATTEVINFPIELDEKIKQWLTDSGSIEYYWQQGDEISDKQAALIMEGKINDVENEIFENNYDYTYELEMELLKECFEHFETEILAINGGYNWDDIKSEMRDEYLDFLSVDLNINELIKRKEVRVRVSLYSNHDCINSHWLESSGGYHYGKGGSYFTDVVNVLNLNPAKVKRLLMSKDIKCTGTWSNFHHRDGKELIDYNDFWVEMENRSCGACLLVFVGSLDLSQFVGVYEKKISKIVIPKGNNCGFFSVFQGGGSVIECGLLRDFEIDLAKPSYKNGNVKYDHFGIQVDNEDGEYSIDRVYGVTSQFWGNEIKITEFKEVETKK